MLKFDVSFHCIKLRVMLRSFCLFFLIQHFKYTFRRSHRGLQGIQKGSDQRDRGAVLFLILHHCRDAADRYDPFERKYSTYTAKHNVTDII